jgi:tetratricopeptide (TPR) repeat protein
VADSLEAVTEARRGNSKFVLSYCLQHLYFAYADAGDYSAAAVALEESLAVTESVRLDVGSSRMHLGLAEVHLNLDDVTAAERHARAALSISRAHGDVSILLSSARLLSNAMLCQGRVGDARELLLSVLDDALRGDTDSVAGLRNTVAWLSLVLGDTALAAEMAEAALDLGPSGFLRGMIQHTLGAALRESGESERAWAVLLEVAEGDESPESIPQHVAVLEDLGAILTTAGDAANTALLLRAADAAAPPERPDDLDARRSRAIIERGRALAGDTWDKTEVLDVFAARRAAAVLRPSL